MVMLGLCLPYLISRSLIYLFISIGCCPRIFVPGVVCTPCFTASLELVPLTVTVAAGSSDVSASSLNCSLGLGLSAYLAISIFSCPRSPASPPSLFACRVGLIICCLGIIDRRRS